MIALLGARDEPTDGVREYCSNLATALASKGRHLEAHEVGWKEIGWSRALRQLRNESKAWHGNWVFVQYSQLAWSRRGFPFRLLQVLRILKTNNARIAVVFHESLPADSVRLRDRIRAQCQVTMMRSAFGLASKSVFTVPPENIRWVPAQTTKAVFIPIGANFLPPPVVRDRSLLLKAPRIGVFCITGGPVQKKEVDEISHAVRMARERVGPLTLVLFGRGVEDAIGGVQKALNIPGVILEISGVVPSAEIAQFIISCDVMLCVRGALSAQRGSALASVACGVPIVGYRGPQTQFPITEIGAEFAPSGDRAALARALCRVLNDGGLRRDLQARNVRSYANFFSWNMIAERYVNAFPE